MDELKEELIEEIYKYYREFTDIYVDENDELYRVSYAYIEFARKEKNLFKAVYISDIGGQRTLSQIIQSSYNQNIIKKIEKQYKFHLMKLANFFKIFDFIRMVLQLMFLLIAFHFRKKKFQNY